MVYERKNEIKEGRNERRKERKKDTWKKKVKEGRKYRGCVGGRKKYEKCKDG